MSDQLIDTNTNAEFTKAFNSIMENDLDFIIQQVGDGWQELRDGRIFITGGTAFFGIWILASIQAANRALDLGCQAVVLSRNPEQFCTAYPCFADDPMISFVTGDIRNFTYPKGSFSHTFHGAVETRPDRPPPPLALMDVLINGTQRVLEFSGQSGVGKLLFLSSGAMYGTIAEESGGITETASSSLHADNPNTTLGIGKLSAEHLCSQFARLHPMEIKTARCFTFVGPFMPMDGRLAIGSFIADCIAREQSSIQIKGDGSPIRSYMYAADLMVWLWKIMFKAQSGSTLNVGSDQPISIAELAKLTGKVIAPIKPIIIAGNKEPNQIRSFYVPSIKKAEQSLNLKLHTQLPQSIEKTASWYRQWQPQAKQQQKKAATQTKPPFIPKTFVCDIDGVVARLTPDNNYANSTPNTAMITTINTLYDAGHNIIMFTARGTMTGIDWRETTQNQLKSWGVRYHELHLGKPAADYYVDDRMISIAAMSEMAANLD